MPRFRRRRLLFAITAMCAVVVLSTSILAAAQEPPEGWFGDTHLHARILIDGTSITDTSQATPIEINLEGMTNFYIAADVVGTQAIHHLRGTIGFYYQSIKVFEIEIAQNESSVLMQPDISIPPIEAQINLGEIVQTQLGGIQIDLITGQFEASVSLYYLLEGQTDGVDTPHQIEQVFFLELPPQDIMDVITSVAGIATTVATGGAVIGTATSFKSLFEGIQTAHKVRSIQKKAGEIRSLPNLTVLGALPALFSILALQVKIQKKKATEEEIAEGRKGVSEYLVRQRVRELSSDAWKKDKCPKCRAKWKEGATNCRKCKIDIDDAQTAYADYMAEKVPNALKALGNKKSLSIRKLAKRTKSNEYNAGVLGAALVDAQVSEIQKVETPIRSFVMNIGGLAFLILTWQTLLGGAASQFQTTLTVVGGALSLAVIVALYFSRKSQIQKLRVELADQEIPIVEEGESEEAPDVEEDMTEDDSEGTYEVQDSYESDDGYEPEPESVDSDESESSDDLSYDEEEE